MRNRLSVTAGRLPLAAAPIRHRRCEPNSLVAASPSPAGSVAARLAMAASDLRPDVVRAGDPVAQEPPGPALAVLRATALAAWARRTRPAAQPERDPRRSLLRGWRSVGLVLLAVALAPAGRAGCLPQDRHAAEAAVGHLDSWQSVHLAYRQYRQCDAAAVAAGFSRAVAQLLADSWQDLPQFVLLARSDASFEAFVLTHLDDTTGDDARRAISDAASAACPKGAAAICARITARVRSLGPWRDPRPAPQA